MFSGEPGDRIIVALDVDNRTTARRYIEELAPYVGPFKIGLGLITPGLAPAIVRDIFSIGGKVFYDGKFNDVPNTVAAASREVTRLSVTMFTVHCLSGCEALKAAVTAVKLAYKVDRLTGITPLVLGVTLLTSLSERNLREMGLGPRITGGSLKDIVAEMAQEAKQAGLSGVVASPLEIEIIRETCGPDFLIITPGVRPAGASVGDQKRVMTPAEAIKAGADYLVIGRPILEPKSGTPIEVAKHIAEEISSVL